MSNFRPSNWIIGFIFLFSGGFSFYQPPQNAYAATLMIMQDDVTIQRANTQGWLPLRSGAVMPLGDGDQVRTAANGRALIEFWDGVNILLLPHSTYAQGELVMAEGESQLYGHLSGAAIHQVAENIVDYRLELTDGIITKPGQQFATWSYADAPDSVTVYEGSVTLETDDASVTIPEKHGWQTGEMTVALEEPLNAAALTVLYESCEGVVDIPERSLRVRGGPGTGYVVIGDFSDGDRVSVLGINQSSGWYRVRLNSHFGWVEALGVQAECDDLPRFADDTQETYVRAVRATEMEEVWLRPFFGTPLDDQWFYSALP